MIDGEDELEGADGTEEAYRAAEVAERTVEEGGTGRLEGANRIVGEGESVDGCELNNVDLIERRQQFANLGIGAAITTEARNPFRSLDTDDSNPTVRNPTLIRQASGNEVKECFCIEEVGKGGQHDLRLGCQCLVHYDCLVLYLREKLRDRAALFAAMPDKAHRGIHCPYYSKANNLCGYIAPAGAAKEDQVYFLKVFDLDDIVLHGDKLCDSPRTNVHPLRPDEVDRFRRWIIEADDETATMEILEESDAYIRATTKRCPNCPNRQSHFHGHSCHHVKDGCSVCRIQYCYLCLQSSEDNLRERGDVRACFCGGWTTFCKSLKASDDIRDYLVLEPYPYDSRCGCQICCECIPPTGPNKAPVPCGTCDGACCVCLGFINQGPKELMGKDWIPQSQEQKEKSAKFITQNNTLRQGNQGGERNGIYFRKHDPPLQAAARRGHLRDLAALLDANPPPEGGPDAIDVNGESLIQIATEAGNYSTVAMLVERGANISIVSPSGDRLLHIICSHGLLEPGHLFIARFLIPRLSPGEVNATNNAGATALHMLLRGDRIRLTLLRLLLEHNATVDINSEPITRAFTDACSTGHAELVRLLHGRVCVQSYHLQPYDSFLCFEGMLRKPPASCHYVT